MYKIAITGNIASGKSQVEKIIQDMGYIVYDSDKIAHEVLDSINDFFGYDVLTNGKIDRKKLGALVFSNPELKKKLEDLTHPLIKTRILDIFNKHKNEKYIFISVPLLYEAGFDNLFDKTLLITVNPDTQIQRLMERNHYSKEEALARINSQASQKEKESKCDYIINNNGSIEHLKIKTEEFINNLKKMH